MERDPFSMAPDSSAPTQQLLRADAAR